MVCISDGPILRLPTTTTTCWDRSICSDLPLGSILFTFRRGKLPTCATSPNRNSCCFVILPHPPSNNHAWWPSRIGRFKYPPACTLNPVLSSTTIWILFVFLHCSTNACGIALLGRSSARFDPSHFFRRCFFSPDFGFFLLGCPAGGVSSLPPLFISEVVA